VVCVWVWDEAIARAHAERSNQQTISAVMNVGRPNPGGGRRAALTDTHFKGCGAGWQRKVLFGLRSVTPCWPGHQKNQRKKVATGGLRGHGDMRHRFAGIHRAASRIGGPNATEDGLTSRPSLPYALGLTGSPQSTRQCTHGAGHFFCENRELRNSVTRFVAFSVWPCALPHALRW
jgi:hypothetical protein